jgi:hypothetical protein
VSRRNVVSSHVKDTQISGLESRSDSNHIQSQKINKSAVDIADELSSGLDSQPASQSTRAKRIDDDQNEIIEKTRAWMLKLVSSVNREAFRGLWRDQWLRSKMREMVVKIEAGSLKEICKAFLKLEVEMNWKALSVEFGKHRTRILSVFGKYSSASEIYRELVFFSRELNPNFLLDGCELPSEAKVELKKLDGSSRFKMEQEIVSPSAMNGDDSTTEGGRSVKAKSQHCLLSSRPAPLDSQDEVTARMTIVDWRWAALHGFWIKSEKRWNDAKGGFQGYLQHRNLISPAPKTEVAISIEPESRAKQNLEVISNQTSSIDTDSALVWSCYRKKEWWPAQVVIKSYSSFRSETMNENLFSHDICFQVMTGRDLSHVPDTLIQKYSDGDMMGKIVMYFDG